MKGGEGEPDNAKVRAKSMTMVDLQPVFPDARRKGEQKLPPLHKFFPIKDTGRKEEKHTTKRETDTDKRRKKPSRKLGFGKNSARASKSSKKWDAGMEVVEVKQKGRRASRWAQKKSIPVVRTACGLPEGKTQDATLLKRRSRATGSEGDWVESNQTEPREIELKRESQARGNVTVKEEEKN